MNFRVRPVRQLTGECEVPGDKSISHRAALLGAIAEGPTEVQGYLEGEDCLRTLTAIQLMGVEVGKKGPGHYRIAGVGLNGLAEPGDIVDCGNSGTTARLLIGFVAGQPFWTLLTGDESLRRRPMKRVAEPLALMGATIVGRADGGRLPLAVRGAARPRAIAYDTPVASAQVKSAILLAGLAADGTTRVREPVATRDHTERMLRARGVPVRTSAHDNGGAAVEVDGGVTPRAVDEHVPGDPSAAAFWLVAGAIQPAARLQIRHVGVNPTRRAVVDLLRTMGARIEETPTNAADDVGEPVADLTVRSSELEAIELGPAQTASAIDEIPILCLAATQARGRSVIRGAGELRHKESDRIAGIVAGLVAMGARIEAVGDDIVIDGPTALQGAVVDSLGDHRLAMTFAIAGLVAGGATTILGADSVAISYPTFFADLERIRS